MKLTLLALKIVFLAFLYIFLFRVLYYIVADLRRSAAVRPEPGQEAQPLMGAELVVAETNDAAFRQGETIEIKDAALLGRGRHNNIRLRDSFVSHNHARIIFRQGHYQLEDLGSVNGTYINGVRLKDSVLLKHGDTIKIAGVTFKFVRWENEVE